MKFIFTDRAGALSIWSILGDIARRLVGEGHQVSFVLFDDGRSGGPPEVPEGVDLIEIRVSPKKWVWDLATQHWIFLREFRSLLRRLKPDLVHTNFAVPSIAARWAAAREGVPHVVSTQHEIYGSMSFPYRWGLRMTEKYCSAVAYVSKTVARSFGRPPLEMEKVEPGRGALHGVISNGVDIGLIRAAVKGAPERTRGKLVCAGRMVEEKGQALILSALKRILPAHPYARLFLIGGGPQEEKLRRLTRDLGLERHVEFTGWLPARAQVFQEMASADLVVVPSMNPPGRILHEGYGLVVAEAILCGSPLLVSDLPVFHEVLEPFPERVRFFLEGDEAELAKGLELHWKSGLAAPARLSPMSPKEEALLSADAMVESYIRLYQRLSEERA